MQPFCSHPGLPDVVKHAEEHCYLRAFALAVPLPPVLVFLCLNGNLERPPPTIPYKMQCLQHSLPPFLFIVLWSAIWNTPHAFTCSLSVSAVPPVPLLPQPKAQKHLIQSRQGCTKPGLLAARAREDTCLFPTLVLKPCQLLVIKAQSNISREVQQDFLFIQTTSDLFLSR